MQIKRKEREFIQVLIAITNYRGHEGENSTEKYTNNKTSTFRGSNHGFISSLFSNVKMPLDLEKSVKILFDNNKNQFIFYR